MTQAKAMAIPKELEKLDKELSVALNLGYSVYDKLTKRGRAISAVRKFIESKDVMAHIKAIKNTDGGFKTDEGDKKAYTDRELAHCITNALIAGLELTGNEFNIIGGSMYITQNGYLKLCKNYEDEQKKIVNMKVTVGEMKAESGLMKIPMTITFDQLNKSTGDIMEGRIFDSIAQLSMKSHETADAWVGKAKRRALKDFHEYLTGQTFSDDEYTSTEALRPTALKGEVKASHTVEKPIPKEVA